MQNAVAATKSANKTVDAIRIVILTVVFAAFALTMINFASAVIKSGPNGEISVTQMHHD